MSENKKYVVWLDLIRVISIFLVIIIHSASPLYNKWKLPASVWMAGNIYNSIARVSVPLLFMVSGYLLLNRQEGVRSFYWNRVRKVVVPLLIWSIIYWVWKSYGHGSYSFFNAVQSMLTSFLMRPAYYHFWFVYALLAIYLFVPVLQVFVHAADESAIRYFALIWFLFGPLLDFVQQKVLNFNIAINLGFFTQYIGYFYLGYVLGRIQFSRRVTNLAGLTYLLLVIYTIYATYTLSAARGRYVDFYHNYLRLNMVIMAISAFIWLKHVGNSADVRFGVRAKNILRNLSAASFGIYLVHVIILTYLSSGIFGFRLLPPLRSSPYILVPTLAFFTFVISYVIIAILQRIPYLRATVPS